MAGQELASSGWTEAPELLRLAGWAVLAEPQGWLTLGLAALRISALVAVAPLFGRGATSWRVRVMLGIGLLLLVAPGLGEQTPPQAAPAQWLAWGCREAAVGLSLGLAVMLLAAGITMAGEAACSAIGMRPDGGGEPGSTSGGRTFELVTFALLLAGGGHRIVVDALLTSFATLPPATSELVSLRTLVELGAFSFRFAVQASAPVVAAAIAAQVALAMLARTQPLLRNATIQASATALAGAGLWLLTIGVVGAVAGDGLSQLVEAVERLLDTARHAVS